MPAQSGRGKMFGAGVQRLWNSPVAWSWAAQGLRVAGGLLLLPLVLRVLSTPDLGMYYVLLSISALLPIIDFGFSVSISRYVSYAMGGAQELKPMGLSGGEQTGNPNLPLLWRLLSETRRLFRYLTLLAIFVLAAVGFLAVNLRVEETSAPAVTWLALVITVLSAALEIYAGWWNVFLRGMNQMHLAMRIGTLSQGIKIFMAAGLLMSGAGLLALPCAGFLSSILQRQMSRTACLTRLGPKIAESEMGQSSILGILWPNSWRTGVMFLSGYLATNANTFICLKAFGLAANAQYGLSIQVVTIIQSLAMAWTTVKWPLVGQYCAQQEYAAIKQLLVPRMRLQAVTFCGLAVLVLWLGGEALGWLGTDKTILPRMALGLLLLNAFLEMWLCFWTTLMSMENRLPFLRAMVASNLASLIVALALVQFSSLGLVALVIAPLSVGLAFNYWYWGRVGSKAFRFGRAAAQLTAA